MSCNCKACRSKRKLRLPLSSLPHTRTFSPPGATFSQLSCSWPSEVISLHCHTGKENSWAHLCAFLHTVWWMREFSPTLLSEEATQKRTWFQHGASISTPYSMGNPSPHESAPSCPCLGSKVKFSPTLRGDPTQAAPHPLGQLTWHRTDFYFCPQLRGETLTSGKFLSISSRNLTHC